MRRVSIFALFVACLTLIECRVKRPTPVPARSALALVTSYRGRDLSGLKDAELALIPEALRRFDPARNPQEDLNSESPFNFGPAPYYIWKFPDSMSKIPGWLVLERSRFDPSPSCTTVRLTLLGHRGVVRAKTEFGIGIRCYFSDAQLEYSAGGLLMVVLSTVDDVHSVTT